MRIVIEVYLKKRRDNMTTFFYKEKTCAICGMTGEYPILASTHDFDGPDLDSRPGNDHRNTMGTWLQGCRNCGYVSYNVSKENGATKELLNSEQYITCDGIKFDSNTAVKFYRFYLIKMSIGDIKGAFLALVRTAWCCDDTENVENAIICRKMAVSLADEIIRRKDRNRYDISLMKLDLMRRAGMFEQAAAEYSRHHYWNKRVRKIVNFQLEKINERDSRAYRLTDVFAGDEDSSIIDITL